MAHLSILDIIMDVFAFVIVLGVIILVHHAQSNSNIIEETMKRHNYK